MSIMERFLKRKSLNVEQVDLEKEVAEIKADPGLRKPIMEYHFSIRDQDRRAFLEKGPCQPHGYMFPQREMSNVMRRFNVAWFEEYKDWLEYSIHKDDAFCLCCYLFKTKSGNQGGGGSFVGEGFRNWNVKNRLDIHVGSVNSAHNEARMKCDNLMNPKKNIQTVFVKQSAKSKSDYRLRLNSSIECTRYLLHQGLPFRGHDESEESHNRGNYLELLSLLARNNDEINNVVLDRAPRNNKLIAPDIQKDITQAIAEKITKLIITDLGTSVFSILIDEARDVSIKEQMAVVLRYVDKKGHIIERFLGIQHVSSTTAVSLKASLDELFSTH